MTEPNGSINPTTQIKLTLQQLVTLFVVVVGFFVGLLATWYDMRNQVGALRLEMAAIKVELQYRVDAADKDHVRYDQHIREHP